MTGEELQILLRELLTPQGELEETEDRLRRLNVFASAIVGAVREGLLVLDQNLAVRFANDSFYEMFQVTPEETLGRYVYELGNGQWDTPALRRLLEDVLPTNEVFQDFEVEHNFAGLGARVMRLDGRRLGELRLILLAIEDFTNRKRLERALFEAKEYSEKIVDTVREALLILTPDLTVQLANDSFYEMFQVTPEETLGRSVYELGNGQWDIPALRRLLEDVLPDNGVFNDFEMEHDFEAIGHCVMRLNGRRVDSV